jgi:hypothetical protein
VNRHVAFRTARLPSFSSLPPTPSIPLNLVVQTPLIPQLDQLLHRLIERHNLPALLRRLVIPIPPIHSARTLFLRANYHDEIVQRQLRRANLLLHRISTDVDVGVESLFAQHGLHFLDVVVCTGHYGDDHDLAGGQPEGPAAREVFC